MEAPKAPLSVRLVCGMEEWDEAGHAIPVPDLYHRALGTGTSTVPTKDSAVFPVPVELEIAQSGRPLRVAYPSPWRPVVVTSRSCFHRYCQKPAVEHIQCRSRGYTSVGSYARYVVGAVVVGGCTPVSAGGGPGGGLGRPLPLPR